MTHVVVGDEIILIGGLGQDASNFELLDQVTAFDTVKQSWRELPPLPFATFAPAAGLIEDTLFVFGGMSKTGTYNYEYVNHIYGLDFSERRWQHQSRYLTETKGFSQVVELDEKPLGIKGGHSYADSSDQPVLRFETFERL